MPTDLEKEIRRLMFWACEQLDELGPMPMSDPDDQAGQYPKKADSADDEMPPKDRKNDE